MPVKHAIEEVSDVFQRAGFRLISTKYINYHTKYEYECPEGHLGSVGFASFISGNRCFQCSGKKKYTIDQVESKFKQRGFELLSTEYKNKKTPLTFKCDKGHTETILLGSLISGAGCKQCNSGKTGNNVKYTYNYVDAKFKELGYTLTDKKYKNAMSELSYICDKGHESKIAFIRLLRGTRCYSCSPTKKIDFSTVQEKFKELGYQLLINESEYTNGSQRMPFICNKGHRHKIAFNDIRSNRRCGKCFGTKRHGIEFVRNEFKNIGYKLITKEYTDIKQYLEYICDEGHKGKIIYNNFQQGARCPKCAFKEGSSSQEQDLLSSVKSFYKGNIEPNDRTIIHPYELDMYFPDEALAVEYCGLYWHSDKRKPNHYHRMKYDLCKAKGIQLLTIFEDEWVNNKDIILSMIKSKLGLTERIHARKCLVKEIDSPTARQFFLDNHIQGGGKSVKAVGLFYNSELVLAISVSKPSRAHTKHKAIINRMSTKQGITVSGGVSKAFAYLGQIMDIKNLVSHCDLRYSNGKIYDTMGFKLINETKYTPHYVKGHNRYRNQSLAKTDVEKLTGKTEVELRREQGYRRIFDCGHQTWQYVN